MKKLISIAFVLSMLLTLLAGCGKSCEGKEQTYTLSDESPVAQAANGVTVDFGAFNDLGEGTELSIVAEGETKDEEMGGVLTAYDLTLGERSRFDGLIYITLPYDETKTIPGSEGESVLAQYWNEEAQKWEIVDYTVDTEANTVTIVTDHLSKYCTVTIDDPGTPYAKIAKVTTYMMNAQTAAAIFDEYTQLGEPGPLAMEEGLSIASAYLGLADGMLTAATLGGAVEATSNAFAAGACVTPVLDQLGSLSQKAGLSLAFCQLALDLYKGDPQATAINAYKNVVSNSIAYYGSAALKVGYVGVLAIDYSLSTFQAAAQQQHEDDVYRYVQYYNNTVSPRSEAEWYRMLLELYKKYAENPEKLKAGIDGLMYNFSRRFFDMSDAEKDDVVFQYNSGKLPWIYDSTIYSCTNRYMTELGESLQPVFTRLNQKICAELKKEYFDSLKELKEMLNRSAHLSVTEEIPAGFESAYAGHTLAIVTEKGGAPGEGWTLTLDDNGCGSMDITLLGYLQALRPQIIDIYKPGDTPSHAAPERSMTFELYAPDTEIKLSGAIPSFAELAGDYADGILTITEVFISDSLRAELATSAANEGSSGGSDGGGWEAELGNSMEEMVGGCDLSTIIATMESKIGEANPAPFSITASGENTGIFILDDSSFPAAYDPATGLLTFDMAEEGESFGSGEVSCAYNDDMSGVVLDGTISLLTGLFLPEDFHCHVSITGSKALAAPVQ